MCVKKSVANLISAALKIICLFVPSGRLQDFFWSLVLSGFYYHLSRCAFFALSFVLFLESAVFGKFWKSVSNIVSA